MSEVGEQMHALCRELFPICRSITGDGFRQSLAVLQARLPAMQIFEVPTGTRCFDWEIPREWNVRDAYLVDPNGKRFCEFGRSNLHLMGYATPFKGVVSLAELQEHLYTLPEQPDAIPYVTSYYKERWGFCLTQREREQLPEGEYEVFIDSELKDGSLTYGELILPGESDKEVFLSTYLCHPSMANNELSGPVVTTFLARWLMEKEKRKYAYRIIFIPETIGALCYLSRNLEAMRENVVAGFNVTCIGDDRAYSYLPSRQGDTLADQAARHVLGHLHPEFIRYSFLDRGSDERQYCSPGIDLPVCSVMRSKYGCYPEYHTSLDDLTLVTPAGLAGGFEALQKVIECLEGNERFKTTVYGEPQLGKRGLYPTLSTKRSGAVVRNMMNFLVYCDGTKTALDIADLIGVPLWELSETIDTLKREGILQVV